jgi:hypothetical protein
MSTQQPKCTACGKRIGVAEAALHTNMADGSREHVHITCLRKEAAQHTVKAAA